MLISTKRRMEILFGRFVLNPMVRGLFRIGISPPMTALLETRGRVTRKLRHTPVNYSRDGQTLWIIAQHGSHAGWVRNLQAEPQIRARLGRRWHTGTAHLVPDDDVRARIRIRTFTTNPVARSLTAASFRALGTTPVTLRVDLEAR
jgi:deazaflavin-dependent oxidoreductase (nitroreductase family)